MIDYISELQKLGLKKVKQKNSEQATASCPFHKDKTPSFSFNLEKGLFHCFSCHRQGNFYQLVNVLKGKDYYFSNYKIENNFKFTFNDNALEKKEVDKVNEKIDLAPFNYFHPYILKRFNGDIPLLQKFEIGYHREKEAITIPIRDVEGTLKAVQLRHLKQGNKNSFLVEANKGDLIYNLNNCLKFSEIIITEGAFDVMKAYQNGYQNTVGLLGSDTSTKQMSLLNSYFSVFNLALDNDDAGHAGMDKIIKIFHGSKKIYVWDLSIVGKKDLGDLTADEMKIVEKNRKPLTNV